MKGNGFQHLGRALAAGFSLIATGAAADIVPLHSDVPTVVILDRSGSMAGGFDWLGATLRDSRQIVERNLGPGIAGGFALIAFIDEPVVIPLSGAVYSTAEDLQREVRELGIAGGTEDGYRAIRYALDQYRLTDASRLSIVLVTNEDRDMLDEDLDRDAIAHALNEAGAVLDVIVDARFRCADGRRALGMSASGTGYLATAAGDVSQCADASPIPDERPNNTSIRDYVDLALNTGGAAWDIYSARNKREGAPMFAAAFAASRTGTMLQISGDPPLVALAGVSPAQPRVGEIVTLDGSASRHRLDGGQVHAWSWDLDNDGIFDSGGPVVATSFNEPGRYPVRLRVSGDKNGEVLVETEVIVEIAP